MPDAARAEALLRKAAESGHAAAAYQLGQLYSEDGRGHERAGDAVAWYRRAAEAGHAPAQFQLAVMLCTGRNIAQDLTEALTDGGHGIEPVRHGAAG